MTVLSRGTRYLLAMYSARARSARCAVLSSAARADLTRSVADDPGSMADELAAGVALFGFEPEPCAFCWSRHLSLMASI